ncbi:hypothetical protein C2E21_5379 [Chlorella sorokiniana]|uniref:Uncharacterized protein n=1 Tax=Chlorella sorokiniana TaxID=3076 RepID=A0A2P6TP49_CHLSO|nr:hypothetical protein C2E21_5379 [Chlorella sorokiniana]|eukprot:PRW51103.1 hypothetical protein C2E21_5379 [Chlorella sorokiniana]
METIKKIEAEIKEGFQAAPGSVQAIMDEAKHAVLNDEPTKFGENDQPVPGGDNDVPTKVHENDMNDIKS